MKFRFTCSYMDKVWYDCVRERDVLKLELRCRTSDYERRIYNGDYDADCVPFVNVLLFERWPDRLEPVPQEIVDAFNAWRKAEVDKSRAYFNHKYPGEAPAGSWNDEIPYPAVVSSYIPAGTQLAKLAG